MFLDERFTKCGYVPAHATSPRWVGLQMNGAQLGSPDNWLATVLRRGYIAAVEPASTAIVLCIDLSPERYEEPVLSVLGLQFAAPLSAMEFWKSWAWDEAAAWHPGAFGDAQVGFEIVSKMMRGRPAHARGHVVSLCQLHRQNAERLVVEPAVGLVRQAHEDLSGNTASALK
jgi:hypothetical protein